MRRFTIMLPILGLAGLLLVVSWFAADRGLAPDPVDELIGDLNWFVDEFAPRAYSCNQDLNSSGTFGWTSESCRFIEVNYLRATTLMERADEAGNLDRTAEMSSAQFVGLLEAHNRYTHTRIILADFPRRVRSYMQ